MNQRDRIILKLLNEKKGGFSKNARLIGNMTSVEQARKIYKLLRKSILRRVRGDVVELGCHFGASAILIQKTIDLLGSRKILHVYDAFKGLPKLNEKDGGSVHVKGALMISKNDLINNFKRHNVKLPEIHQGWFRDTLKTSLPDQISFAHLDSDLYESILLSLESVYPRLSKGAIVVIDDYSDPKKRGINNYFPGVKRACDEFLKDKVEKVKILHSGTEPHGYFIKK